MADVEVTAYPLHHCLVMLSAAGQTYRLSVYTDSWDLFEPFPFVLTTSIESGPVIVPTGCEKTVRPADDWVCIEGGRLGASGSSAGSWLISDAGATAVRAIAAALSGARITNRMHNAGSVRRHPRVDWSMRKRWVGYGRLSTGPNGTRQSNAARTAARATNWVRDAGSVRRHPGLVGVCANGGWVPIGHPLARRAP